MEYEGVGREALLEEVQKLKTDDNSTKQERLFAYVYTIENESLQIQGEMFDMFAGTVYAFLKTFSTNEH